MNSKLIIVLFIIITMATGCNNELNNTQKDVCNTNCETPMEYLIQSNCPFTSICYENKCQVVCPIYFNNFQSEENNKFSPMCEKNSDCDCSWRGNRTKECICFKEKCYSIEG